MRSLLIVSFIALTQVRPGLAQTTAIVGATIIDGRGGAPVPDGVIIITGARITAIGPRATTTIPAGAKRVAAEGKFVVPGLMDANVHLVYGVSIEYLARYEGRFEEIIEEAAQVSLKNGLTTVFDSWGPLQPLINVRDRINRGETPGSRLYVAGNIIGFTGPFGRDFNGPAETQASPPFAKRINALWEENTGPELMWLSPDSMRSEIRKYAARPNDFLKYGVSGHTLMETLMFSPEQQKVIVEEGHRAGKPVETHSTSVESLRQAIEAGVDLMQHCSITGRAPIPESTLRMLIDRKVWCTIQPNTQRRLAAEVAAAATFPARVYYGELVKTASENETRLIRAGAPILLATDAGIMNPDEWERVTPAMREDNSTELGPAHFRWFDAVTEKGMKPMDAILAATRNIAAAYRVLNDFGTLEPGKRADLLILDADPLASLANLRRISAVFKDGVAVDRDRLPVKPLLTAPRH